LNFRGFSLFLRFVLKNATVVIAEFDIEFVKLKDGKHHFQYEIDKTFFEAFENDEVADAQVSVSLELDKQYHMIQVDLEMTGKVGLACDRCLEVLRWPVNTKYRLIYKLQESHHAGVGIHEENVEMVILPHTALSFNVAQAIYESVLLEVPMLRNCDSLETKPCNKEMLEKLMKLNQNGEGEADPRWDKLKELLK
jgi:uncharacterized metal-binding protein YceD (DUF177 family)